MEDYKLKNIWIIDDEEEICDTMKLFLEDENYYVKTFTDEKKFLKNFNDEFIPKPDLIFVDYRLSEMNGAELTKIIKKAHKYILIVLITAYGETDIVLNAFRAGIDEYLNKPFGDGEIIQIIKKLEKDRIIKNRNKIKKLDNFSALGKFTTSIIHDIKNPLTVIKSNIKFIEKVFNKNDFKNDSERLDYLLKRIHEIKDTNFKAVNKIEEMINDIINFSKFDIKIPENKTEFIIVEKINLIFNELKNKFTEENIIYNFDFNIDKNQMIKFDENLFFRIFMNLFSNSIDALKDTINKKIDLYISKDDIYLIFKFKDNGLGIKEENIGKIFLPFYSTRLKKNGLGIGLANVNKIIKKEGGEITCKSEYKKYTEFTIKLKLS